MSVGGRLLEQPPIGLGQALEQLADLEVVAGHRAHQRHPLLADVLGDGLLVHLGGQVVATLGGILMEGALQKIQGGVDLALELFLAKPEEFGLFAHKYTYKYAYFL